MLSSAKVFLNHLCDGEPFRVHEGIYVFFLNHLCDGEPEVYDDKPENKFLNHLCDGELNASFTIKTS